MTTPEQMPERTERRTVTLSKDALRFYEDHAKAGGISTDEYIRRMLEDVPYRALVEGA